MFKMNILCYNDVVERFRVAVRFCRPYCTLFCFVERDLKNHILPQHICILLQIRLHAPMMYKYKYIYKICIFLCYYMQYSYASAYSYGVKTQN